MEKNTDAASPDSPAPESPRPSGLAGLMQTWRENPSYRFVVFFMIGLAIVSFGYPWFVREHNWVVQKFILWTAQVEYWMFVPFTDDITLNKKLLVFKGFAVTIVDECTGVNEMLIFSAAVLAFPTSIGKKLIGLLLGNPLIYLFNVLRIAMLIVVGKYWYAAFDFMHLYFWQATMIVMIVSVWLLWIIKVVNLHEDRRPEAA